MKKPNTPEYALVVVVTWVKLDFYMLVFSPLSPHPTYALYFYEEPILLAAGPQVTALYCCAVLWAQLVIVLYSNVCLQT